MHSDIDRIRKLAVISLFYDDETVNEFVLKGGNALALVYGLTNRASVDIDVSMESAFTEEQLEEMKMRLLASFTKVFGEAGYTVFDFKLYPTPGKLPIEYSGFWGGYTLEFKVIETTKYANLNLNQSRLQAAVIGDNQQKVFTIDISKYEYVKPKAIHDLDGYAIFVYTPVMVLYEKLRAICQQMEAYREIVRTNRRPRSKDFFDIYTLTTLWDKPDVLYTPENLNLLKEIFEIKHVPLSFLGQIASEREFHRDDFNTVRASLAGNTESYDFYFDFVLNLIQPFEEFWQQGLIQSAAAQEQAEDQKPLG